MNAKELIEQDIYQALNGVVNKNDIVVEYPKNRRMGDYAIPCFSYSKIFKKSPIDIANEIKSNLKNSYEKVEIVNGYLNIYLNKYEFTETIINKVLKDRENYGSTNIGNGKKIVIDYSAPNIAKPFGIGHLRSTVIGNAIRNISEKIGYKTFGINYLGDWGTQFGKLIYAYKTWGNEQDLKNDMVEELRKLYVKFHEEAEKDESLNDQGRYWFKKIEDQDEECLRLWQIFKDASLEEFKKTYELLNITNFDSYDGESFYNDKMEPVVQELEEKNLLKLSEGASIVDLGEDMPPALIKRTDGATLYITRDIASAMYRKNNYHFDEALYVVGNEQMLHFNQLKKVLDIMGYSWTKDIKHINFGLILQNGKKMSTRKGTTLGLHNLLLESIKLAKNKIIENNGNIDNIDEISRQIGVGAIIFNDLKNYRINDIEFNLEETLNFVGETGPYLQYTNARINSLLVHKKNISVNYKDVAISDQVWDIIFKLYNFEENIIKAKNNYDPSVIAKYLIDLASLFNKFYGSEKFITEDINKTEFNLLIALSTSIVLKEGMRLLGVEAPLKM